MRFQKHVLSGWYQFPRAGAGHCRALRARDTRERGAREARDLKEEKSKQTWRRAALRARLLLSCFKRNSRISETVSTSTTLCRGDWSAVEKL